VADPWSSDFAALGEHSRHGLRSLQATRASLHKEPKMRFHKAHPALAALIALVVIGIGAPLAYAFVRDVFVNVDPDKPADQIQQDVTDQLKAAGVEANVKAEKPDDGPLKITIESSDEQLGSDLHVKVGSQVVAAQQGRRIEIECHDCDPATQVLASQAVTTEAVITSIDDDAAVGPAITKALTDKGFTDVKVTVAPDAITVSVAPPSP
jgi:hypothetical protein